MEHSSLSALVRENALATYLGLVAAVDGAVVSRPMAFTLVRGPGAFSFCNFAAGFDVQEDDVAELVATLRSNASDCFGFYVFLMTGDRPDHLEKALVDGGFEVRQRLVGMAAPGASGQGAEGARLVAEHEDRVKVAGFMSRQFFWNMPSQAREAIAAATAASGHTIWCVGEPQDPEAAVMLVEQQKAVGLFNLCVRPESRRQGLGSRLVQSVLRAAQSQSKLVVLQCGEELVPWYRELGFERVGAVQALTFQPSGGGDILV